MTAAVTSRPAGPAARTMLAPGVATVVDLSEATWACGFASPAQFRAHLQAQAPEALCAGGRKVDLSVLPLS